MKIILATVCVFALLIAAVFANTACSTAPTPGNCQSPQIAYFFLDAEKLCVPYIFSGCGNSANHFTSLSACESTCTASGGVTNYKSLLLNMVQGMLQQIQEMQRMQQQQGQQQQTTSNMEELEEEEELF